MTPEIKAAIAEAIAEISILSTSEFHEKLNSYHGDSLALSLTSLAEFADHMAQSIRTSFVLDASASHAQETLIEWYDDILVQLAANDDRYLLAA